MKQIFGGGGSAMRGTGELGVLDLPYLTLLTLYSTVAVIKVKVDRLLRNELKMKGTVLRTMYDILQDTLRHCKLIG